MENGDDAMAEAQLALLYKLGVLTQDAGEEQRESENDVHAFLNRMLPPPPYGFEASSSEASSRQTSGERDAASSWESIMSPYAPVQPYTTPRNVFSYSDSRAAIIPRVPLSPLSVSSLRSDHRHIPRKQDIDGSKARVGLNRGRDLRRRYFDKWKDHCANVWRFRDADCQGRKRLKRRYLLQWQAMVHYARLDEARCTQFMFWRLKRKVAKWKAWAKLYSRVGRALSGYKYQVPLMNRLRRERTWVRWRSFILRRTRLKLMANKARVWRRIYTCREYWVEWRIHVMLEKRKKKVYEAFFMSIRLLQREEMATVRCVNQMYRVQVMKRVKRLYHRWWLFTIHRHHERKRAWEVKMIIFRGRVFTVWYNTMNHLRKIMPLRQRVMQRIKFEHIRAWRSVVVALQLSYTSTLWHPGAIQARYFAVWMRWALESVQIRAAKQRIAERRKRRGIRLLRSWSIQHRKYSRLLYTADGFFRKRVLRFVWEEGLMVYHSKRKEEVSQTKSVQTLCATKVFRRWRKIWEIRFQWRAKKSASVRMAITSKIRQAWGCWKQYFRRRRAHRSHLAIATTHHAAFMKLRGLVALSEKPERKLAYQLAMRQIRSRARELLKRRVFLALKILVQHTNALQRKVQAFKERPSFTKSLLNPLRRMWTLWTSRVFQCILIRQFGHNCAMKTKTKAFLLWRKHIQLMMRSRDQIATHQSRLRNLVFGAWRSWIECQRKQRDFNLVAMTFFERSVSARVFFAWKRTSSHLQSIHQRSNEVHVWSSRRIRTSLLLRWKQSFLQRIGTRKLEDHRRLAWLQFCWDAWRRVYKNCIIQRRKLKYFHKVFGQYPCTSPLRRYWLRWREWNNRQSMVKHFKERRCLKMIQISWNAFKLFGRARIILREWHKASLISAADNNDLGKRLRTFRERRTVLRLALYFNLWIASTTRTHTNREKLLEMRKIMLKDLKRAYAKRRSLMRWRMRLWFRRWRCHQLQSLHQAVSIYWRRLGRKVLRAWWRHIIHSKQEHLLSGARQTLGLLSAQKVAHKTLDRPQSHARKTLSSRSPQVARRRATKSKLAGGMIDTLSRADSYSLQYQRVHETGTTHANFYPRLQHKIPQPCILEHKAEVFDLCTRPRQRNTKSSVHEELPLYDEDLNTKRCDLDTTAGSTMRHDSEKAPENQLAPDEHALSLESIMQMNPYSPGKQYVACQPSNGVELNRRRNSISDTTNRTYQESLTRASQPTLFKPEQSLQLGRRVRPSRQRSVQSCEESDKNLADILGISVKHTAPHSSPSVFRSALHGMAVENTQNNINIDADDVTDTIIRHYVARSMGTSTNDSVLYLQTWGFCLLRDLSLFVKGYFVNALERSIDRVSPSNFDVHGRYDVLVNLLNDFLASHPAYQAASTKKRLSVLSWLITKHLVLHDNGTASGQSANAPRLEYSWTRNLLPDDVIHALPKLIKCFKKYQKPLTQFFVWRPRSLVTSTDSMNLTTFILLMRDRQVHPQLFDRRELEEAVLNAVSKHKSGADVCLDFPQFVEALVRCSLRLQWGDDTSVSSDVVVVLRFLMLIFAMEGKGSMLTKRSQDIETVMTYLRRPNASKQTDKLRRFQNFLMSEEVNKGPRKKLQLNQNRAPDRNASKKQPDTELSTQVPTRKWSTQNEPIPRNEAVSLRGNEAIRSNTSREQKMCQTKQAERRESYDRHARLDIDTLHHKEELYQVEVRHATSTPDQVARVDDHSIAHELPPTAASDSFLIAADHGSYQRTPHINDGQGSQTYPPVPSLPMSRDAFLDDILCTMNDVELILQQSEPRRPSRPSLPRDCTEDIVHLSSEPFSLAHPERYSILDTDRSCHASKGESQSDTLEEIAIRDPVLNYLTFEDRFSELTDWDSTPSIAEIAENGIYAAFPSSVHVMSTLQTGELDDLTSPQPALAYLRDD